MNLRAAIAAYAVRLHGGVGSGHHIASPLAAYLLLALVAPVATGEDRSALEEILGCSAEEARREAAALLAAPHPEVRFGFAAWHDARATNKTLEDWLRGLPAPIQRGKIPTQAEADAWVRQATLGLLDRYPAAFDDLTRIVLASALAAKVQWRKPFELARADMLGASPWTSLGTILHEAGSGRAVARTSGAGIVGTQCAMSDHMWVVSVIAEPSVPPATVIGAAHEVAMLRCGMPSEAAFPSLFDLPTEGHAWSIVESTFEAGAPDVRVEHTEVFIPQWTVAGYEIDLTTNPAYGFEAALGAVWRLLPPNPAGYVGTARQVAKAKFDRCGFEAAALAEMETMLCAVAPRDRVRHIGRRRDARVRFGRPFAVVAVAAGGAWQGLPVFSGWITTPERAELKTTDSNIPPHDRSAVLHR